MLDGEEPSQLCPEGWGKEECLFGPAKGRLDLWFLDASERQRSGWRELLASLRSAGAGV